MDAPVTAIVAYDIGFYEKLPASSFRIPMRSPGSPAGRRSSSATAFRNGTLQGAYMIIAARALGLDCGPMSGFDNAKVDAAFFPDGKWRSNFLCNLGYGDPASVKPRNPRLSFEEACPVRITPERFVGSNSSASNVPAALRADKSAPTKYIDGQSIRSYAGSEKLDEGVGVDEFGENSGGFIVTALTERRAEQRADRSASPRGSSPRPSPGVTSRPSSSLALW